MARISPSTAPKCCAPSTMRHVFKCATTAVSTPSAMALRTRHYHTSRTALRSQSHELPSNTAIPATGLKPNHTPVTLDSSSQLASFSTSTRHSDSATPAAASSQDSSPRLTWDDFLKMRRRRRYVNLAASAGTAMGSVAVAAPLALQYGVEEKIAAITGLESFIAFGLTITAVAGLGWLMGPSVGNAGFMLWNRSIRTEIARKEKDFYDHVKRFRADPTSSSVNNPVPDYYGEKIGSVSDYRRWLKDQRAFNRKKSKNLL